VGGGYDNRAGDDTGTATDNPFAVVSGGAHNIASGVGSTVGGGYDNGAGGEFSSVGGGFNSGATGDYATVAGGIQNYAPGGAATIAGGSQNTAIGGGASVGGGAENVASGFHAVVAGGFRNTASGVYSAVPGGSENCAGGKDSWAGGYRAKVRPGSNSGIAGTGCNAVAPSGVDGDFGTFVWADHQEANFTSTGPNQFLIRAQGGVAINTNTPGVGAALTVAGNAVVQSPNSLSFGSAARQMLNLYGTSYGIGVQSDTQYFRSGGNGYFAWFKGGVHSNTGLDPGAGGSLLMTLGPAASTPTGTARAQSFTNVSDRASKTGFEPIDASEVLARVTQLPLSQWSYRNEPTVRHLGPVAQDFRAAFGLGEDERTISTVDSAGVALAAIQGLNAKLERENAALRERLERIEAQLAAPSAHAD
jgi:hypothetical protein